MSHEIETRNIRILLISDDTDNSGEVEQRLLGTIDFPCYIRRCPDFAESMAVLKARNPDFDVILVDLSLVHTGRPREIFNRIWNRINDIPIIIFNGSVEHKLSLFLIEEGASDTITKDQAEADPDRLRSAIESAMIRSAAIRKSRRENRRRIAEIEKQAKIDLDVANNNGAAALKKSEEENARNLREKEQIINWITGGYSVER